ncbi:MAG: PAS domain S-box protein [Nitrospinota bacterium]|nr:PAS domain S-box protein [Nitrospinota bacterium]
MNKGIFNRLSFLVTGAFVAAIGVLCLAIGFYWFNFIVPSIRASEQTRAEMVLEAVIDEIDSVIEGGDQARLEDAIVKLLLMKDSSSKQNLILGIRVEQINGTSLVKYSSDPVEISGLFAFSSPLYSSTTQEILGEVSLQYNPHFYEILVEDAQKKLLWLLVMVAGIIFILQRVLFRLLRPLSDLNRQLGKVDFNLPASSPTIRGWMVSEINEVVQSIDNLFTRLDNARESESKARQELVRAQSVSKTGNWVWDIVTNDLYWSDEIYRIFGLPPQEFEATYDAFLKVVHPDDRNSVDRAVRDAMAGVAEYDMVHRLVRPDGTVRFVSEKSDVTRDEEGNAIKMVGTVQDITDQKLAEDLSLRFGRVMDEAFNEIYIIDQRTFKFVQINKSAVQNIQYTMEEMSAMTPADISPDFSNPEDLEPFFRPLLEGEKDRIVFTSRHLRKDGTSYPVEVLLQISKHETPPKIIAIAQDITQRQKAEKAMQDAMKTLEVRVRERTIDLERITREKDLILNTAGEGIYGLDREGNATFLNPAAEKILGYSSEELIGTSMHQMTHHSRADGSPYPREECRIYNAIRDGQAHYVSDEVFWRKDSTPVTVEYVCNPINEDGKLVGAVVTFKDITERKRAEEELQKSEEKFRKYFELPLVGIAITSLEKGWLEVNDRLCDFVGYPRDELTRLTWAELTHPDDLEADVAKFNKVLDGESEGYTMEKRFIHKNGEVLHAEISVRCVRKPDGQVDYFVALVQDINARKKAEQELILAKEEAERASNAKSEFLSQMSHELRTPLNAILGFGQVLEGDPEEPLTEFQQQGVAEILKGGKHLLELINEILDLSRIEAGQLSLSLENVNLSFLTEELVTLCDPMAKKNGIELLNYVPLHDDRYVFADRVRLKQILLNLVSNAIKYNKPGGTVKMDAGGDKNGGICISVADTGIGLSEQQINNLFQPFNRLGSEKTEIEGTGVGLTITKRLVEHMNGTIKVESKPGAGSTFSVTFPIGTPEADLEDGHEQIPLKDIGDIKTFSSRGKWVVLYVEDNPANLNLVRHIFHRRPDSRLLTAPDAKLGLELAQAHQPDLILMDINLPGMDGITALQRLREMEDTRKIPVVAISANAMTRDIKHALASGFADYLTKPLDITEFNRMLNELLHREMKNK